MSVRALSGNVGFILQNEGRELANPPVVFPPIDLNSAYTSTVWVKLINNTPINLMGYVGVDGTQILTGHDGTNWFTSVRIGSVVQGTFNIKPITLNAWTMIGVGKSGFGIHMYYGLQDPNDTTPWLHPVTIIETSQFPILRTFLVSPFAYFQVNASANHYISCLKIWTNILLGVPVLQTDAQTFAPVDYAGKLTWNSTFRTPGDISNNAHPYADRNWAHGHAFSQIVPPNNLEIGDDPAYMANTTPCPTWVYPTVFTSSYIDPGLTPLVPTVYKAPQFFQFADVGSVPPVDFQVSSIIYYGMAFGGLDGGTDSSETWGLYKDENDIEIADMSNIAYRFVPGDTGVTIPGPITATNMYGWKFGAQFKWNPVTPQGPTNTAFLAYLLLYVTYIGYPTGFPILSAVNLSGLFAIKKDKLTDTYNNGTDLRIPNPTVRTALIGE